MTRIVLDTSVLISFLLTRGSTISRILDRWESGDIEVVVSPGIIEELKRVAAEKRIAGKLKPGALDDLLQSLQEGALLIPGQLELPGATPDPGDDMVIACAVEGEASYIITRDPHLLGLREYEGILILDPEQFVSFFPPSPASTSPRSQE